MKGNIKTNMSHEMKPVQLMHIDENFINTLREIVRSETQQKEEVIEQPINVQAAANFLELDIQTVYRMLRQNKVPAHKRVGKWYFFKSELNEWIKNKNV